MSDRIHVATRKGLFTLTRVAGGASRWKVSAPAFLGDPVSMVLADARDGSVYAALNLGHFGVKLHRSPDDGKTWEEVAVPAYPSSDHPAQVKTRDGQTKPATLELLWILESAGADQPGALWAGTIPGGLFRSEDRGASWKLVESLWNRPERLEWFGGGYDQPGIHSICVDPRDSRHVTLGISCGGAWDTRDRGASWTCKSKGMYAEFMPPDRREDPNIQDPHRVVQCPAQPDMLWAQHHNGVFRSTDGAANWQDVPAAVPSKFGFAVAVHPADGNTAWFVPAIKDERRVPVNGQFVVSRTRDGGKSFEVLRRGLPEAAAYDLVYRHGLDVDATGKRLAMGSTSGGVWISEDGGDSWLELPERLPPVYCVRFG